MRGRKCSENSYISLKCDWLSELSARKSSMRLSMQTEMPYSTLRDLMSKVMFGYLSCSAENVSAVKYLAKSTKIRGRVVKHVDTYEAAERQIKRALRDRRAWNGTGVRAGEPNSR